MFNVMKKKKRKKENYHKIYIKKKSLKYLNKKQIFERKISTITLLLYYLYLSLRLVH